MTLFSRPKLVSLLFAMSITTSQQSLKPMHILKDLATKAIYAITSRFSNPNKCDYSLPISHLFDQDDVQNRAKVTGCRLHDAALHANVIDAETLISLYKTPVDIKTKATAIINNEEIPYPKLELTPLLLLAKSCLNEACRGDIYAFMNLLLNAGQNIQIIYTQDHNNQTALDIFEAQLAKIKQPCSPRKFEQLTQCIEKLRNITAADRARATSRKRITRARSRKAKKRWAKIKTKLAQNTTKKTDSPNTNKEAEKDTTKPESNRPEKPGSCARLRIYTPKPKTQNTNIPNPCTALIPYNAAQNNPQKQTVAQQIDALLDGRNQIVFNIPFEELTPQIPQVVTSQCAGLLPYYPEIPRETNHDLIIHGNDDDADEAPTEVSTPTLEHVVISVPLINQNAPIIVNPANAKRTSAQILFDDNNYQGHNADTPFAREHISGMTFLMYAAQEGNLQGVREAIENCKVEEQEDMINIQDNTGKTALHYAVRLKNKRNTLELQNKITIIQLLLNYGIDPDKQDHKGQTAFDIAQNRTRVDDLTNALL